MDRHLPATKEAKAIFGERLRRARTARGLSLEQVAQALKVSKPSVWGWEQGYSRPRISRLSEIAKVLEVPLLSLVDSQGQQDSSNDFSSILLGFRLEISRRLGLPMKDVLISISFGDCSDRFG